VRSVIVLATTAAVILVDSGWWVAAAVVSGVVLFGLYHRAELRHSPYQEGWY